VDIFRVIPSVNDCQTISSVGSAYQYEYSVFYLWNLSTFMDICQIGLNTMFISHGDSVFLRIHAL
jgi:hypothetical protein